jgi:hypothetical protein
VIWLRLAYANFSEELNLYANKICHYEHQRFCASNPSSQKKAERCTLMEYVCFKCCVVFLIGFDVHLLQTKISCYEASLCRHHSDQFRKFFMVMCFVKYFLSQKYYN